MCYLAGLCKLDMRKAGGKGKERLPQVRLHRTKHPKQAVTVDVHIAVHAARPIPQKEAATRQTAQDHPKQAVAVGVHTAVHAFCVHACQANTLGGKHCCR